MKVLITAGGTRVPIDDVRHIGNMSTGHYGSLLVDEFNKMAHKVTFFVDKYSPYANSYYLKDRVTTVKYSDYEDYHNVKQLIRDTKPDIIFSTAAVSDYVVDKIDGKISSDMDEMVIRLKRAEKILPSFKLISPESLVFGFKLLASPTEDEKIAAIKRQLEYVDYVVYNDLDQIKRGNTLRYVYDKNMTAYKIISPLYLYKFAKQEYRNRIN
jgi:phosphopantothenoylcysteine synthetase/decarboxylase